MSRDEAEEQNIALVRRLYELANDMQVDEAFELFAEDVVWEEPAEFPDPATRTGRSEVRRGYEVWVDVWDSIQLKPVALTAAGDQVLASLHATATAGGSDVPIEFDQWQVWTIRDGLATHMSMFSAEVAARRAVGLAAETKTPTEATNE